MAEWLIERGIGETRAILVDNGAVIAAKLHWPGELAAGQVVEARLTATPKGSARGIATTTTGTGTGTEILLDKLPRDCTQGSTLQVLVTRAPIAERGRLKRAQGRVHDGSPTPQSVFASGRAVRSFPAGLWEEAWHAASGGEIAFAGGSLLISVTPAMTLIDIDGHGSPRDLALAAVPALADALALFDLGGSIGIDFPTIEAKADRKAVDAALGEALDHWPHERTAMNGFGFVQIVARLEGPSLLHRFATSRVGACARMALRRAEMVEGTGSVLLLTVHPALKAKLKPAWLEDLARRTGKELRIETSPALALEAANAQLVAS